MNVQYRRVFGEPVKTDLVSFITKEFEISFSEGIIEQTQDRLRELTRAFASLVDILVEKDMLNVADVKTIISGFAADFSGQLYFLRDEKSINQELQVKLQGADERDPAIMSVNAIKAFKQLSPGETMSILVTGAPMEMKILRAVADVLTAENYVESQHWLVSGREYVLTRSQKEKPND